MLPSLYSAVQSTGENEDGQNCKREDGHKICRRPHSPTDRRYIHCTIDLGREVVRNTIGETAHGHKTRAQELRSNVKSVWIVFKELAPPLRRTQQHTSIPPKKIIRGGGK